MELDTELDLRIAELAWQLKHQFTAVLMASPAYGSDRRIVKEMDILGNLIKELEDAVVIARMRVVEQGLEEHQRDMGRKQVMMFTRDLRSREAVKKMQGSSRERPAKQNSSTAIRPKKTDTGTLRTPEVRFCRF